MLSAMKPAFALLSLSALAGIGLAGLQVTGCSSSSSSTLRPEHGQAVPQGSDGGGGPASGDDGGGTETLPDGAVVTPPHDGGKGGGSDGSTPPVGDGGEVVASGQWVMGYYVGYDINAYPIASIDWTGLTHIIFSPVTVNSDLSQYGSSLRRPERHGPGRLEMGGAGDGGPRARSPGAADAGGRREPGEHRDGGEPRLRSRRS